MERHVKRVPLHFLFVLVWFLFTLSVKSMSMKRSSYIIHMNGSHMPKAFSTPHNWYVSMINNSLQFASPTLLDNHKPQPSLLYTYNNVLHGFSDVLTLDELEALKKYPGFISAYIDTTITLETTHTPSFLSLDVSNGIWNVSNYGKDIIIGILDTGVWPESPSFNDKGISAGVLSKWNGSCEGGEDFNSSMCNGKIIGVRYFNKGMKGFIDPSKIISKDSARDDIGHGTQVASIAAGNYVDEVSYFGYAKGTAVGIAPHARLAIYKVSWNEVSRTSDTVSGLRQAIDDGVDVINISFATKVTLPLYEDAIAAASFSAMEKGIVVVAAAGNKGPNDDTVSNGIPWVLTVTASTIDRWFAGSLIFGNGETISGWSMFPGETILQNLSLVYKRATLSSCTSLELYNVKDKIIMCDSGNFTDQIDSIAKSNASGAIIVSDIAILRQNQDIRRFPCPCVVISSKEARVVMSYINMENNDSPMVTMNFKQTFTKTKPAPTVAYYASRGPSLSFPYNLKPDIMAPGSWVLAAWVPNIPVTHTGFKTNLYSSYIINSGTSLACPHVAGVVALLKAAHPNWSTTAIISAIITSADKFDNTFSPIQDYNSHFASPFDMGAGHINPNKALNPGLVYDATPQDFVNLLCSKFSEEQVFTITTRNCSNPSPDFNYPSFLSFYSDRKASFVHTFQRTVTNVGEGAATYEAKVVPVPLYTIVEVSPMTLVFQKKYEQRSYNVTITYKGMLRDQEFTYGELVWVDKTRKYKVSSPIVVHPRVEGVF
ncbi:subtilisin-like protease SBT3 [Corylus avellana]|uniref:subtilisin-like protease SBT3 n=1 Tax=Corylus avellana TaxID=13451 RepID=UPI00286A336F|nr:subtilisin-like protease SBT3 [Corylus avellana]